MAHKPIHHPPSLTPQDWNPIIRTLNLPPQQARIVSLILQGKKYKQIALEMHLSIATVRTYLARTFTTLGVSDRVELVSYIFAGYLDSQRKQNQPQINTDEHR